MLTLLPAASLTARLAWLLRLLYFKLQRGGRTEVRWVYGSTRDPPARQEDAAHDRGQRRVDANAEGVQEAGRKEKGPRNEMCSLVDASRNVQGREEVRKCVNGR